MMERLDELWFRLLDRLNLWTLDRMAAQSLRDQRRRLRRLVAGQNPAKN